MQDIPRHASAWPWAHDIHTAAERGAALTRQLLAFSRKSLITPIPLNLNTLVLAMGKLLARLIGEHIELEIVPAPGLGNILADPVQLEQVIMNLAINARDAMPMGGQLYIATQQLGLTEAYVGAHAEVSPGLYALLTISDTGVGMSPDTLTHIFEPFFTTKEMGRGTGLGLATVYGVIKQIGGHIFVYSELEHGTTFKIYIPLLAEASQHLNAAQAAIPRPTGTETILLVEDDENVRNMTQLLLKHSGYHVLVALHGQDALRVAQAYPQDIDLLLTDVVMPQMNGPQLVAALRLSRPNLRILYMSGYTDDAVLRHGVLHAHTQFLPKPFTLVELTQKVRDVLDHPIENHVRRHRTSES